MIFNWFGYSVATKGDEIKGPFFPSSLWISPLPPWDIRDILDSRACTAAFEISVCLNALRSEVRVSKRSRKTCSHALDHSLLFVAKGSEMVEYCRFSRGRIPLSQASRIDFEGGRGPGESRLFIRSVLADLTILRMDTSFLKPELWNGMRDVLLPPAIPNTSFAVFRAMVCAVSARLKGSAELGIFDIRWLTKSDHFTRLSDQCSIFSLLGFIIFHFGGSGEMMLSSKDMQMMEWSCTTCCAGSTIHVGVLGNRTTKRSSTADWSCA